MWAQALSSYVIATRYAFLCYYKHILPAKQYKYAFWLPQWGVQTSDVISATEPIHCSSSSPRYKKKLKIEIEGENKLFYQNQKGFSKHAMEAIILTFRCGPRYILSKNVYVESHSFRLATPGGDSITFPPIHIKVCICELRDVDCICLTVWREV